MEENFKNGKIYIREDFCQMIKQHDPFDGFNETIFTLYFHQNIIKSRKKNACFE